MTLNNGPYESYLFWSENIRLFFSCSNMWIVSGLWVNFTLGSAIKSKEPRRKCRRNGKLFNWLCFILHQYFKAFCLATPAKLPSKQLQWTVECCHLFSSAYRMIPLTCESCVNTYRWWQIAIAKLFVQYFVLWMHIYEFQKRLLKEMVRRHQMLSWTQTRTPKHLTPKIRREPLKIAEGVLWLHCSLHIWIAVTIHILRRLIAWIWDMNGQQAE